MRGEYRHGAIASSFLQELPPRARRILTGHDSVIAQLGTTSACAENTKIIGKTYQNGRNYLRVRGEYRGQPVATPLPAELPPRARRIPRFSTAMVRFWGTTSACAENTALIGVTFLVGRNYLRVRGEYPRTISRTPPHTELPPRARRIQVMVISGESNPGTTSACAENTWKEQIRP